MFWKKTIFALRGIPLINPLLPCVVSNGNGFSANIPTASTPAKQNLSFLFARKVTTLKFNSPTPDTPNPVDGTGTNGIVNSNLKSTVLELIRRNIYLIQPYRRAA